MLIDAKNIMLIPLCVVHFLPYSTTCVCEKKERMFEQYFAVKQKLPLAQFVWFQWSRALFSFSWQPVNWLPRILPAVSESGL